MSEESIKKRAQSPEEKEQFKERMARRLAAAGRNRHKFPFWRRAQFRERPVWVCCDEWGIVPKRRLRMMFGPDSGEYTPAAGSIATMPDDTPHELRNGRFVARPPADFVELYTDGSSDRNAERAGCAAVIRRGREWTCYASPLPGCSAQEAEVLAVGLALKQVTDLDEPIAIITDCDYVVRVLKDRIVPKGASVGCRKVRGLFEQHKRVVVRKIKGHSGIQGNEEADRLAGLAMRENMVVDGQPLGLRRQELNLLSSASQ